MPNTPVNRDLWDKVSKMERRNKAVFVVAIVCFTILGLVGVGAVIATVLIQSESSHDLLTKVTENKATLERQEKNLRSLADENIALRAEFRARTGQEPVTPPAVTIPPGPVSTTTTTTRPTTTTASTRPSPPPATTPRTSQPPGTPPAPTAPTSAAPTTTTRTTICVVVVCTR